MAKHPQLFSMSPSLNTMKATETPQGSYTLSLLSEALKNLELKSGKNTCKYLILASKLTELLCEKLWAAECWSHCFVHSILLFLQKCLCLLAGYPLCLELLSKNVQPPPITCKIPLLQQLCLVGAFHPEKISLKAEQPSPTEQTDSVINKTLAVAWILNCILYPFPSLTLFLEAAWCRNCVQCSQSLQFA